MEIAHAVSSQESLLKLLSDQKYALDQAAIVAQTDKRGVITYVNDRFCEISGYEREELVGKTHSLLNSGVHDLAFFTHLWKTIAAGQVWRGDVCNRKKSGELYWVATTIVPFLDTDNQPYQYLAIRQEITALKQAEEKIMEQQAHLVMSSKLSAIGEMVAAVTHEINNPLGVILGRCEMMRELIEKDDFNKETLLRMLNTMTATGQRIEKIVRSLKVLSFQNDEEPLQKIELNELIETTLELMAQRFRNHQIQLIVPHVAEKIILECRPHHILQVLVNLLSNAYDAVNELPEKWVRIDFEKLSPWFVIQVTDSGSGISVEHQAKLFNPFFSTKKVQYGTGLGLSISRSLMQKQGGSLDYDPKSPHTRFVVRIPMHRK